MKPKESILQLGFTFAGCYLGAGYVSGQELWQFFGCFGWQGIGGLLLAVALSFFFGVLLLRLVQRTGCDQTDALVIRRSLPLLRGAVGLLQLLLLFGLLVIMTAGVSALAAQLFGPSVFWGAAFSVTISCLSLSGTSGMMRVFSAVVPLLVICSVMVSAFTLRRCAWQFAIAASPERNPLLGNWVVAAILFFSYNLFSSVGILAPVGKVTHTPKTVWRGVLLGCIMLFSIALGIVLTLQASPAAAAEPLPMLSVAKTLGKGWCGIYALLLFGAMFGTALSCAVALRHYCTAHAPRLTTRSGSFVFFLAALSWGCSMFGFGELIGTVYPACGALGALAMLGLLHHSITLFHGR